MGTSFRKGPVAILGIGDPRAGDDGLGATVVAELRVRYRFDGEVRLAEAPGPDFDLASIEGARALILVQAIRDPWAGPGTLRFYRREALLRGTPRIPLASCPPRVREALLALAAAKSTPADFLLIGAAPRSLEQAPGLTSEVHAAIPLIVQGIVGELRRLGIRARLLPDSVRPAAHAS